MSSINRNKIRKLILKEFKMMGMQDMSSAGMKPMGFSDPMPDMDMDMDLDRLGDFLGQDSMPQAASMHKGGVSREDCCAAVMCLIECCSCPVTKQTLMKCCEDIMSGMYDG
tara:strand:- start:2015 stop:2347 length:333 start_codon:yes stop_codon:yes gene_type:complete